MADVQLGIKITADGSKAKAELTQLSGSLNDISGKSQRAVQALESTNRTLSGTGAAAQAASRALYALGAALSARELIAQADAYNQLTARLKLAAGTTAEYGKALNDVRAIANAYQQDINAIGQTYQQLAPAVQKLGMSQQDLADILAATSAGLKVSGTSAGAAAGFMTQFAQALNSSRVQAEEWNSIQDGNLALVNALEKQLPELVAKYGNLKAAINDGAVSNEILARAVKGARAELEAQAKTMGGTVSGALIVLKNGFTELVGLIDKTTGSSKALVTAINALANGFKALGKDFQASFGVGEGSQIAALEKRIAEQKNVVENMRSINGATGPLGGLLIDTDEMAQREQAIRDMERALADLKQQAQSATATDTAKPFFDGVKRGATEANTALDGLSSDLKKNGIELVEAAAKAYKLNAEQKAVVAQIVSTAEKSGFDPALLLSIAKVESSFNRLAKASTTTASGVFQFVKGTRDRFGLQDPFNVEQSTIAAIKYLTALQDQFKNTRTAVSAYYSGEGAIAKNNNQPDAKGAQYAAKVAAAMEQLNNALGVAGKSWDKYSDQVAANEAAFKRLKLIQDDTAKSAEEYAAVQIARVKTNLASLQAETEAQKLATAAQLASARTIDEKQAILARAAQQAQALYADERNLILEEISLQQSAMEARRAAYVNELSGAQSVDFEQQLQIKQAIRAIDTELEQLAETRRQAEIEASSVVNEYGQQSLSIKAQEAQALADLTTEYQKQQNILTQLQASAASGATATELANLASLLQSMPDLRAFSQGSIDKATELNQRLAETTNQIKNLQTVDQKFAEQQLRLNAAFEDGVRQAQIFASRVTEAFGKAGEGIGKIAVSVAQYFQQAYQVDRDLGNELKAAQEQFAKGWIDETALVEREFEARDKAATKSAQYQIGLFGDLSSAAKGYFEEGSKGYAALENATKVFRAFEMAMALKSMLVQVAGNASITASDTARTGTEVSNAMVRGQAKAVEAVANQASGGDPYSAFPRVAAMAAIMAALGFAVLGAVGGGGMSAADRRKERQDSIGTGTVFGDPKAQSDSITKSLEIIRDNSSNDLNYSAAMLSSLQSIETAMRGVAAATVSGVGPNTTAQLGDRAPLSMGMKGMLFGVDPFLNKLLLNVSTRITDYGIQTFAQTLEAIIKGGFQGLNYTEITKTTKLFTMKIGESVSTEYSQLDSQVTRQFTKVIKSIADAVKSGGEAFGLSATDFNRRMKGFVVDFGTISTAGMSGEEIEKMLNALFSGLSDRMAKQFMPGLRAFQQIGEGYFATMIRVGEGINRANGELAQLGITAIKYTDIINKQGRIDEELFKQSYLASGQASEGLAQFIQRIQGTAQELKDAVLKFIDAEYLLKTAGLTPAALQGNAAGQAVLIDRVGGLDNLVGLLKDFNDSFLTESQRTAGELTRLADSFGKLGISMPDSKEAFSQLVNGLDLSTESGKALFGALLQLAGGFAKVQDQVQAIKDKYADILNPFGKIGAQIEGVTTDFNTLLTEAAERSRGTLDSLGKNLKDSIAEQTGRMNEAQGLLTGLEQSLASRQKDLTDAQAVYDAEMAKSPKQRNAKRLNEAIKTIQESQAAIAALTGFIESSIAEIGNYKAYIEQLNAEYAGATGAEKARLEMEKAELLANAGTVMTDTLGKIFDQIAEAVKAAQGRLDAIVNFQQSLLTNIAQVSGTAATSDLFSARAAEARQAVDGYWSALADGAERNTERELQLLSSAEQAIMAKYNAEMAAVQQLQQAAEGFAQTIASLKSQIATLQGPQAVAGLAGENYATARQGILDYLGKIAQPGAQRDYAKEVQLIQAGQQAVMDKYNAEMALIQQAAQAQADALSENLQRQIDAINESAEAAITAQQKLNEAEINAQQKANEAVIKAAQKVNEAEIKARQKAYDAEIKALQKRQEAQLKPLQAELDAANKLRDAIKSIGEYAQSMKLGPNATLSPEAMLRESERQYQELLARANAGDAEAISKLSGASDAYLDAAKKYYGSSSQYQNIFDGVQSAMETLGAMSAPDPDSIQSRIDALREAQAEELDRVRELQQDALDLLREQQGESLDLLREQQSELLDAIRESQQGAIDAIRKSAQDQIKVLQDDIAQQIRDLNDPEKNQAMKALRDAAVTDLRILQRLTEEAAEGAEAAAKDAAAKAEQYQRDTLDALRAIADNAEESRQEAVRQYEQAKIDAREQYDNAYRLANDQLIELGVIGGFNASQNAALIAIAQSLVKGWQPPVQSRARGGYTPAGLTLVGEQGPELVKFERPTQVLTAQQTREALSGESPKTFAALEAIKAELRAIVVTQSNANPQLIERLAAIESRLNAMERQQRIQA